MFACVFYFFFNDTATTEIYTLSLPDALPISLIEAVTYRLSDHTTADDASRYRPPEEVSAHWKEEPIARLRAYLADAHAWTKAEEEALIAEIDREIEDAVAAYEATPPQPPEAMFDYLYATLPEALARQRAALLDEGDDEGDGDG